jgi:ribosomal protein S25
MRKIVEVEDFTIELFTQPLENEIIDFVKKNKYIAPVIAEEKLGIARSSANHILKRMADNNMLKDMGSSIIKRKNGVRHRCHIFGLP